MAAGMTFSKEQPKLSAANSTSAGRSRFPPRDRM